MKQILSLTLASSLVLGACAQTTAPRSDGSIPPGQISNEGLGAVVGGVAGGLLGGQIGEGGGKTAAAVAGALIGAWAGSHVARSMTQRDVVYVQQASTQAATIPVGETVTWYNPESGNQGTITPTRDGRMSDGRYCREFQQTVTIDGQTERAYGTACQNPDGTWQIVN